jgi:hypothetical protein
MRHCATSSFSSDQVGTVLPAAPDESGVLPTSRRDSDGGDAPNLRNFRGQLA